jgi:hypothetical protein
MAVVWVLIWGLASVLAYYITEAACFCFGRTLWDRPTKECIAICSILLGPVFLLISVELLVLAAMGRGLTGDRTRTYKD